MTFYRILNCRDDEEVGCSASWEADAHALGKQDYCVATAGEPIPFVPDYVEFTEEATEAQIAAFNEVRQRVFAELKKEQAWSSSLQCGYTRLTITFRGEPVRHFTGAFRTIATQLGAAESAWGSDASPYEATFTGDAPAAMVAAFEEERARARAAFGR